MMSVACQRRDAPRSWERAGVPRAASADQTARETTDPDVGVPKQCIVHPPATLRATSHSRMSFSTAARASWTGIPGSCSLVSIETTSKGRFTPPMDTLPIGETAGVIGASVGGGGASIGGGVGVGPQATSGIKTPEPELRGQKAFSSSFSS